VPVHINELGDLPGALVAGFEVRQISLTIPRASAFRAVNDLAGQLA